MDISFLIDRIVSYKDALAVVSTDYEYTYEQIYKEYLQIKNYLSEAGIRKNSVVAVKAEFSPKSIATLLALIELNCIIVPISNSIKTVDTYLRIAQVNTLITIDNETITCAKLDNNVNHEFLIKLQHDDKPGLILFSSGTTGDPKAAVHDLSLLVDKFRKDGKKLSTICFLLFDHIGGFNTLMHTISNGGLMVTLKQRSVDEVCSLIEKYRVELLPTSPTFINMILLNKVYDKYDLSSLKLVTYGTEPMPQSSLDRFTSILPNIKLKQTYGLSEVGILPTKSENSDSLWVKIRQDENFKIKIVDDILYIKSKTAMLGYLNAPNPFDEDGWFNTKDKVLVKGDLIKILGRTTDLINVGGQKVYPNEVESVLLTFAGVLDVRVFGEKNPILGQTVSCEIEVKEENDNRDFIKSIRKQCKEKLESFKIPTKISLTIEPLYSGRFKKKR